MLHNYLQFCLICCISIMFCSDISAQAVNPKKGKILPSTAQKLNKITPQMKWLSMEFNNLQLIDHGSSMSWYASFINHGSSIQKNRLVISGVQMMGTKIVGKTGQSILYKQRMDKGQTVKLTHQTWSRIKDATHLKISMKDRKTRKSIEKIIALPDLKKHITGNNQHVTAVEEIGKNGIVKPTQELEVLEALYKGRGAFSIKLNNTGNSPVRPEQLSLKPIFFVDDRPPVIGNTTTNPSGIAQGSSKIINGGGGGIYYRGMAECWNLSKILIEIRNPVTNQLLEHEIKIKFKSQIDGRIKDLTMGESYLDYVVQNTGSYKAKFKIKMKEFSIYLKDDENDLFGKYKGKFLDGLYASITLKPGEKRAVGFSPQEVNAEIKSRLPNLKDDYYMAKAFRVDLYTEDKSEFCSGKEIVVDQFTLFELDRKISDDIYLK